jgi:hypothetical protein
MCGMISDGQGLNGGGVAEAHRIGQPDKDMLGHGHILGKGAMLPILGAGNAKHAAMVAEVHLAAAAEPAPAAGDRGVKRDAIAHRPGADVAADLNDCPGSFVSHHDGWLPPASASVHAVDVAAANAAGCDADEDILGADRRHGPILEGKTIGMSQDQGVHICSSPSGTTASVGSMRSQQKTPTT